MSVERQSVWTCDRCQTTQTYPSSYVGSPPGWVGVMYNTDAANAADEHDKWHRLHLCPQCWTLVVQSLQRGASA